MKENTSPGLLIALTPIFFLIIFLTANVFLFEDTLAGSNQIVLFLAAAIAALFATHQKISFDKISDAIIESISKAMPAILILLLIGSLAGTWLLSGVVPTMIYYGLKIINPNIFLFTAFVVCSLVSLAIGSSWSTVATVGIALLGIGKTLGFSEGIVAGAIISGAYFGDKISPLSDTTNLAPAVAGTDLFTHVRYMMITTTPSAILTMIIFLTIGFFYDFNYSSTDVNSVLSAISNEFFISPILLLVPILLFIIILKKVQPIPALLFGTILAGVFAVIFQHELISKLAMQTGQSAFIVASSESYGIMCYKVGMNAMIGNQVIPSSNLIVNDLFHTSGMRGMLNTVWLILAAMTFGGAMEAAGFLKVITNSVMKKVKSTGSLIASTIFTSIFFNLTASDQYISIVVPGRMYAKAYRQRGLKPEVLSRTLEDAGTLTSVLVPWNTCGATQSRVLGVSTITYLPYCFLNIINPIVAIIIGYLNYKIRHFTPEEMVMLDERELD